jgi:hypothetical protein
VREIIAMIAGVLFVVGYVPYAIAVIRRRAVPTRSTRIVWWVNNSLAVASMYATVALNLLAIGALVGSTVILALSFKYGDKRWGALDGVCLVGVAVGAILWATADASYALIASQISGFIGSIPTIRNVWRDPSVEDRTTYGIFGVATVLLLASLPSWTFLHAIQPVKVAFVIGTVNVLLWTRPRKKNDDAVPQRTSPM